MQDILTIKDNYIFVSRGATAIYLVLKARKFVGKKVLVPANICYAAIYPIVYSGNIPVFCDVSDLDGNVTCESLEPFWGKVDAMILPHMYGNPINDIELIAKKCRERDTLLIEDCASAMGASIEGKLCGSWGDYSIFSTGYSKTLDLGTGGILISNHGLKQIQKEYQELPEKTDIDEENENFYSKLYRLIRNNGNQTMAEYIWSGLRDNVKNIFIHKITGIEQTIKPALLELEPVVMERRKKEKLYSSLIHNNTDVNKYEFSKEATPWRFCAFINSNKRRTLIDYLLEQKVPVSDWYPVVTPIFGEDKNYLNASKMENEIINFPLLIADDEIRRICELVNAFFENV